MSIVLRDYQQRAIDELWAWFRTHQSPAEHPLVESCVASGKSVMIAAASHQAITQWPGTRVVAIAHTKELVEQNIDKMRRIWPEAKLGVWSASLGSKTIGDMTFATIGSIYQSAHLLGPIALVHCDEAHLVNPKDAGMWRAFLSDLRACGNPRVRVIGWTGTPYRGDGVWLTAGDEAIFTHITARIKIKEMLALGYLAPLVPAVAPTLIDTAGVRTVGTDYDTKELAERANRPDVVAAAALSISTIMRTQGRKRVLVYCVTIEHAISVCQALWRWNINARVVTGKTPAAERDQLIGAIRSGAIECLVNVGVLTTGFDVPEIDMIALLRPTKSPVLYVQIMGRGMRIALGKVDCLVADYTTTAELMGPVDLVTGHAPRKKTKEKAPFKICDKCGAQCALAARVCPDCGWPFPIEEKDPHATKPTGAAMLSSQLASVPEGMTTVGISRVTFGLHAKPGKKPCVMVTYFHGVMRVASEWLHFEQPIGSPMRTSAVNWWKTVTGIGLVPNKVDDALAGLRSLDGRGLLRMPVALGLDERGRYPIILRRIYADSSNRGALPQQAIAGGAQATPAGDGALGQEGAHPSGDDRPPEVRELRPLGRWLVPDR
jgi:DNA repair protein RadD